MMQTQFYKFETALTLSVPRTSILVKFVAMPEPQILYLKYALLISHNPTYFHVSI